MDQANCISRFFMYWVLPSAWKVHNSKSYSLNDLENIPNSLDTESTYKRLSHAWYYESSKSKPSFIKALFKTFGWQYFKAGIPFVISQISSLAIAILLNQIINYFEDSDVSQWEAILYSFILLLISFLTFIQNDRGYLEYMILGLAIEGAIYRLIYEKILNLPYHILSSSETAGHIITLISTDNEGFRGISITGSVWTMPLYIIAAAIVLGIYLGWAGVIGLCFVLFTIPLQIYLAKKNTKLRFKISSYIDSRVHMIGNILEGIRVIKIYTWEFSFSKIVNKIREKEIYKYMQCAAIKIIMSTILVSGQGLIILATFWIYVSLGGTLKLSNVFCGASVLMTAHFTLTGTFANGLLHGATLLSTSKRIKQFLLRPSRTSNAKISKSTGQLEMIDITAGWDFNKEEFKDQTLTHMLTADTPALYLIRGISIHVSPGELWAVIGTVGSGKSTILKTIIEETYITNGDLAYKGSIAYVEQQPWIMSGTIKENIIMGEDYDQDYYEEVLKCCCLELDINSMKHGSNTQTGVKGENLSGGQKARIALARAAYAQRDIYLLDDPFCSVDSKVADYLFKFCINGILKNKTRLLVTNNLEFLPQCDKVILIDAGKLIFEGTYEELKKEQWGLDKIFVQNKKDDLEHAQIVIDKDEKIDENNSEEEENPKSIQENDNNQASVKFKVYFLFLKYGFKSLLIFMIFIIICVSTQSAYIAMQYWIAIWSSEDSDDQKDYWNPIVLLILSVLVFITTFFRNLFLFKACFVSTKNLHNDSFKKVLLAPVKVYDQHSEGKLLNIFSRDIWTMDNILISFFTDSVMFALILLSYFITIIYVVPYNIFAYVAYLIYAYCLHRYFAGGIRILKRKDLTSRNPIYSLFSEIIEGIEFVRSYSLSNLFRERLMESTHIAQKISFNFIIHLRAYMINATIFVGITLGFNAILIVLILTKDNAAQAGLSLSFTASIMSYLPWIIRTLIEVEVSMANTERVTQFIGKLTEGELDSENFQITEGRIEFWDVSMRYQDNLEFVLKNVSFNIEARSKVGIIGRTGGGKSTLIHVLYKMYPLYTGNIVIDGQDIANVGLHTLRRKISIIPQIPFIFSASLKDNLDPLNEHTDKEIWEALGIVNLKNYFTYLNGLDTHMHHTVSLSVGQKQLLCLARAILKKNKILVIDEATAFVDYNVDHQIQQIIRDIFKDSTVIAIAHRLSTLKDYDKIIVMDGGKIEKIGSPVEIIGNIKNKILKYEKTLNKPSSNNVSRLSSRSAAIVRELSRSMSMYNKDMC